MDSKLTSQSIFCNDVATYRVDIGFNLFKNCWEAVNLRSPKIFEIGPGNGAVIARALEKYKIPSNALVFCEPDLTKTDILKSKFPNSRIITAPIESFDSSWIESGYDIVFAGFSLHWIEALSTVLKNIHRLLKSSGVMGITITDQTRSFWTQRNQEFKKAFKGCAIYNDDGDSHNLTPTQWIALLEKNGFSIFSKICVDGVAATYTNPENALKDFRNACGTHYLKRSSDYSVEECEKWIVDRLLQLADKTGRLNIPATAFQIIAKKK